MSKINNCGIFFQLICNVIFFAAAIYQMEEVKQKFSTNSKSGDVNRPFPVFYLFIFYEIQSLKDIQAVLLFFSILCLVEGLTYTFFFCYFASQATSSCAAIGTTIYSSFWYTQPAPIQKKIVLMIARAQIPTMFMGFKMIRCTLESFMKVSLFLCPVSFKYFFSRFLFLLTAD